MAREFPIPFKYPTDNALKPIFGSLRPTTRHGRRAAEALSREFLGLAPTANHFLYSLDYIRDAFADIQPLAVQAFPDRAAWQANVTRSLARWAHTAEARTTIANTITSYYNTIGQFAIKLEGRGDRLYIPNPADSDDRPLDYVGISPSDVSYHLYYERTRHARHAYVPLLPDESGKSKGVLGLAHWNIPGIQTPGMQDVLLDAFEAADPIVTPDGLEISPLSMFCAGNIVLDQVTTIPSSKMFGDSH